MPSFTQQTDAFDLGILNIKQMPNFQLSSQSPHKVDEHNYQPALHKVDEHNHQPAKGKDIFENTQFTPNYVCKGSAATTSRENLSTPLEKTRKPQGWCHCIGTCCKIHDLGHRLHCLQPRNKEQNINLLVHCWNA